MKSSLFCILLVSLFSFACTKTETVSETYQIPIYQRSTEAEAEAGLQQKAAENIQEFGNIYRYQDYLLVNELGKGIHIYDNSNPQSPTQISFMQIPGNYDLAIRNDVLFVDSYDDLLSLDIRDPNNIQLLHRKNNVFPQYHPSIGRIVGYKDTTVYYERDVDRNWPFGGSQEDNDAVFQTTNAGGKVQNPNQTGIGGSMARFTISGANLYTVDQNSLHSFNISNASQIQKVGDEYVSFMAEIETIFPYQNYVFIGSTNGVFIYNVSNPAQFQYVSEFTHARACDPVYVSDSLAFVTLRSNTNQRCIGTNNQLDVLNVTQIESPTLLQTFGMTSPYGLGVSDSLIFICEGEHGVKVFDFDKIYQNRQITGIQLNLKHHQNNLNARDVIPLKKSILVVGPNTVKQYSVDKEGKLNLISSIQ